MESFKTLAKSDPKLARFLNRSIEQKSPEAIRELTEYLGGKHVQVTPDSYGLGTTTYLNLDQKPKEIREAISDVFGRYKKKSPLAASGYSPVSVSSITNREDNPAVKIEKQISATRGLQSLARLTPILPAVKNSATGFSPSINAAISKEKASIAVGIGGASPSARPVVLPSFKFSSGKVGPLVANSSEFRVPNFAGGSDAIFNQDMVRKQGLPSSAISLSNPSVPVAAKGIVPNAAKGGTFDRDSYDYSSESVSYIAKQQAESAKRAASENKKRSDDFARAQEEILSREREAAKRRSDLERQKAVEVEKGFSIIEKEQALINAKKGLTQAEIKTSEQTLSSLQQLYKGARERGSDIAGTRKENLSKKLELRYGSVPPGPIHTAVLSGGGVGVQGSPLAPLPNTVLSNAATQRATSQEEAKKRSEDFGKAKEELLNREQQILKANQALDAQKAADLDRGFALIKKEQEELAAKKGLTQAEIKASEEGLEARRKQLQDARRTRSAQTAPIYSPATARSVVEEVKPAPNAPYNVANSGIISSNPRLVSRLNASRLNEDAEEQRLIAKDLIKDQRIAKVKSELQAKENAQNRSARLQNIGSKFQNAGLLGSFAAGFIPEGTSGETTGKLSGTASGLLTGAGLGGSLGSFGGPIGAIAGTLIGGLIGAVAGFNSRSKKSFEELAGQLEEANAKSAQILQGAAQSVGLQGNIKEAIDKGQSSTVIQSLVRQQRAVDKQLPTHIVRQRLEAGFDEEKQQEFIASLSANEAETRTKSGLARAFYSIGDNKTKDEALGAAGALVRSSVGNEDTSRIDSLLKKVGSRDIPDYLAKIPESIRKLTPNFNEATGTGLTPELRANVEKEILSLISKTKLDPSQQKEATAQITGSKDEALIKFLNGFRTASDNAPYNAIEDNRNQKLASLRTPLNSLIRQRNESQELGAISGQFANRSIAARERGSLDLGDLTDQQRLSSSAKFNVAGAQREAFLSNGLAQENVRTQFLKTTASLGASAPTVEKILNANKQEDFAAILKTTFKGDEIQGQLGEAITELKKTVLQNDSIIQLTKEQNRIDQLIFDSQQNQKLLASGTFSGDTRATSRSLFSNLKQSRGPAQTSNVIDVQNFLNQIGLPQTDEGLSLDRETRSVSVRDNLSSVLSGRLKRKVGSSKEELEFANEELGNKGTGIADQVTASRITAALKSLDFDPVKARQELQSGKLSSTTLE